MRKEMLDARSKKGEEKGGWTGKVRGSPAE